MFKIENTHKKKSRKNKKYVDHKMSDFMGEIVVGRLDCFDDSFSVCDILQFITCIVS